jgi:toxin ParE1/3/4
MRSGMLVLKWRSTALADLLAQTNYIAEDNPDAAQELRSEIEARTSQLLRFPKMYRAGRVKGTREMFVRPNYIVVYAVKDGIVSIERVLHAAQEWP